MAAKTTADKFDEVKESLHQLDKRADLTALVLDQAGERIESVETLVHEMRVQLAVQRSELDELKKSRDTWGVRWWQLVSGVVLAFVGGVIGYLLKR